jgi:hypothetical protein
MSGIWHPYSLELNVNRFRRNAALTLMPLLLAVCLVLPAASRSEAAANGLTLAQSCTADGIASLSFGWQGTGAAASELWLDVGTDNAWRPGGYASAGPLIPGTRSYEWPGFTAGLPYYVRVSELRWDQTWEVSQTANFTTFACRGGAGAPGSTTGAGASAKPTASATGYVSDNAVNGSVSATGNGPAIDNLSATAYVAAGGGSSSADAPPANAVARPQALPLNPNTHVVPATTYFVPPTVYYMPSASSAGTGAGDVDCAGGTGNGPNYVTGPVRITGADTNGLDRDKDGIGCERS